MSDGWVRVEDGLPEVGETVWVWDGDDVDLACWMCYGAFHGSGDDNPSVTHWRYADVPEPPAGE